MKQLLLLLAFSTVTHCANAQPQTGITTFNRSPQPAVIYNLTYSEEAVWNGVENKMNPFGKSKNVKGFNMYKNIIVPEIGNEPITLYFNAAKKSNKENTNAVLTMMLSNEFDRFYSVEENSGIFAKAITYLNSFEAPVAAASLELEINAQDDIVKKTEKKLKNLHNDGNDYEKEKKKLEAKIAQNTSDATAQEQEVARQKEQLDILIKQRKNQDTIQ